MHCVSAQQKLSVQFIHGINFIIKKKLPIFWFNFVFVLSPVILIISNVLLEKLLCQSDNR